MKRQRDYLMTAFHIPSSQEIPTFSPMREWDRGQLCDPCSKLLLLQSNMKFRYVTPHEWDYYACVSHVTPGCRLGPRRCHQTNNKLHTIGQ